jgi:hypothetical protein
MSHIRLGTKLIFISGSIVFSLLLAELAVRILHLAPDIALIEINAKYASFISSADPVLKYQPKPSTGDINDYGIRDYPRTIKKPEGVFRILVLGDSIGFGYCSLKHTLTIDQTFPHLLEQRLAAHSFPGISKVEVINLSVSGYNTLQETHFFKEKGIALSPDLVLIAYCLNDDQESASLELRKFKVDPRWSSSIHTAQSVLLKSHLFRLISQRLAAAADDKSSARGALQENITDAGFKELKAFSEKMGFKVLNVVFPNLWRQDHNGKYLDLREHKKVEAETQKSGFALLDLLEPFEKASADDLKNLKGICEEMHPNEKGHEVAAEVIEQYLIENHLIQR